MGHKFAPLKNDRLLRAARGASESSRADQRVGVN